MDTSEVTFHVDAEREIEIRLTEVPNGLPLGMRVVLRAIWREFRSSLI